MSNAIGLRFVPYKEEKHLKCHFFGAPVLTPSMQDEFPLSVFFLGMIDLKRIASLDKGNRLPHQGYLYFFFDSKKGCRQLLPIVRYVAEEPTVIVDDFNDRLSVDEFKGIDAPCGVEFFEVEEDAERCKLLGVPCDWNYEDKPERELLLTLDHYDDMLDFLPFLDGFTYIFFGEKDPFRDAKAFYEYS
ncbi:MAG: hypothetical protein K6B65_03430 [Bacilli bacterium]|nr:hypothetical protein [Bacilli bacterium]